MTTKHTPEPWEIYKARTLLHIHGTINGSSEAVTAISISPPRVPEKEIRDRVVEKNRANAARIVACVNACAGINPEAVPEMLEALIECAAYFDAEDNQGLVDTVEKAIEKAGGRL